MTNAFDRRSFLTLAGAAGLSSLTSACATGPSGTGPRVVVVGGGFGGATAAKYLRRQDPSLRVTLVERSTRFITCPFSNSVIGGFRSLEANTFGYDGLRGHGVEVIHAEVTNIDAAAKLVVLQGGEKLAYDKLVLSPGIDFKWGEQGYSEADAELAPHAWKAGPQTLLLRRQLEAMEDGGVVVMTIPANPYRCPPGPYERASLIAHYLKTRKPRSKLLLLDAKDSFSKQPLFVEGWDQLYKGLLEWVPLSKDGKVVQVDAKTLTVETEFGTRHKASVLNHIPQQSAGRISIAAGLADSSGWVPVVPQTFQSAKAPDIYVVGDATNAAPQPKSGFSANSQAKVAAAAIVAALRGQPAPDPIWMNTCYSLLSPDYGITVAGVYRVINGKIADVPGSGGISPKGASAMFRGLEASYAESWYANITQDIWG
ncbi:putative Sulfide dehydrogenase [flavocytochrome c] flavoprotein chain [Magnetospirillum sp. XM-1]|uniref:NAD(P)/FAD-dependent oxidoreductase n=1 Tax=Magnetospirillum sp. XM-1 TaxID=1663591 RepID=UPI00073E0C7D|nr:NAD(P)/FAD-dependent oxidoreductase [Magnetospirillum sp. XM-1]CUW39798.1 putative Sulfide dehydrogenase [flavocytochrome c] flavoprotein chain [Magnetospirillum sp. XM-1]